MERTTPWPHAPQHRLSVRGTYFVTVGTYLKRHHFRGAQRLCVLHRGLLTVCQDDKWRLEAWAVFSNHYHFIAHSPEDQADASEKSYLARLRYVHQNAVRHGLVLVANQYPWCSARWFERSATPAQVKTIYNFKIDRLQVYDDYAPDTSW